MSAGTYVISGRNLSYKVIDKRTGEIMCKDLEDHLEARYWIEANECDDCGLPRKESQPKGCNGRHIVEDGDIDDIIDTDDIDDTDDDDDTDDTDVVPVIPDADPDFQF